MHLRMKNKLVSVLFTLSDWGKQKQNRKQQLQNLHCLPEINSTREILKTSVPSSCFEEKLSHCLDRLLIPHLRANVTLDLLDFPASIHLGGIPQGY